MQQLEEKARQIAYSMKARNLHSWHIKGELENHGEIAPIDRAILEGLVEKELKELESY